MKNSNDDSLTIVDEEASATEQLSLSLSMMVTPLRPALNRTLSQLEDFVAIIVHARCGMLFMTGTLKMFLNGGNS